MKDRPENEQRPGTPGKAEPPRPAEPSAEPKPPTAGEQTPFRIKDQFRNLNSITPSLGGEPNRPSRAPVPGSGLSEAARPGHSIRNEVSFQDFFRTLDVIKIARGIYRRFWIVLLCAFGLMLLLFPAGRALQGGAAYTAESVIIYTNPEQKQIDVPGSSFLLRPLSQSTLVDMLLSPSNIRELENAIGLRPLKKSLSFDTQSKSDIITLQVSDMPDEETAIQAAALLAETIISNNRNYYRQLAESALEQYTRQRTVAKQALDEAVQAVEQFQLKHQLLELSTQYENYFAAVSAARERFSVAQVAHEGLKVRITNYEKMIRDLPDEILDESQEDNPLKRRISNAEAALLQARIQFAADNPKVLRQEREIEELRKMLQSGSFDETRERTYVKNPLKGQLQGELLKLRSEEEVAARQVEALKQDIDELDARFQELPRLEKEYAALLEQRAQLDANYKTLSASEDAARMTLATDLSDFKLLHPPMEAENAGDSLIGKVVPVLGFIFGFFGGLALVVLIELLDAKIRTQQQLENAFNAPCLASIAEIPNLQNLDAYNLLLPSLREISERLNVVLQGRQAKALGFFSSLDSEGKSTLSFNLARYYSSLDIKVLFVSFDARPNHCLPLPSEVGWPQKGIEEYLAGSAYLPDMISKVHGVDVIRIQTAPANLLDLAKGAAMPRLWDLLRENYELIITDAPSVLDHPLSGTIAGFQDELVYILASQVSDRKLVDAGLEFLEERGLVPRALIFNRVDPYYLDDIRQQRTIRNLTDQASDSPARWIQQLASRFKTDAPRPTQPAPEGTRFTDENATDLLADLGKEQENAPEPATLPADDEPAQQDDRPQEPAESKGQPKKDLSFRDWLKDPNDHEK